MDWHRIGLNKMIQTVNYALVFVLVWQCLLTLKDVTTEEVLNAYILFTFLAFVFFAFGIKKYIAIPILSTYALYETFVSFYKGKSDFLGNWVQLFWDNASKNLDLIFNGKWDNHTSPFNTFIFFVVILAVTLLLHIWIQKKWSMLLLTIGIISFLAVLGEFYDYYAKRSFIRVVILGITLVVLTNALRFAKKEQFKLDILTTLKWIIPSAVILLIGIMIGFYAPKQEAQWRDPIAIIKKMDWFGSGNGKGTGEGTEASIASSGYGIDASKLGGDLKEDNSVAFIATDEMKHYWKIDDLDFYTGHGWKEVGKVHNYFGRNGAISSNAVFNTLTPNQHISYNKSVIIDELEAKNVTKARINIKTKLPRLPYPYPYREVATKIISNKKDGFWYQFDFEKNMFSVPKDSKDSFTKAQYNYKLIEFDIEKLKQVALKSANSYSQEQLVEKGAIIDSNSELDKYYPDPRYVQLPEGFSNRVKLLAEEITKDIPSDYDKIKAIEKYLKGGKYEYALNDVAVPKKNQDYVDQFLFESKKGYCDNFSSSFVLLCRSLNFQARWARGFTDGSLKGGEKTEKVYEITNLDAHSWGEVYFNDYGWVPFEPTPGFTNDEMFKKTSITTNPGEPGQSGPKNNTKKPIGPDDALGPKGIRKSGNDSMTFTEWIQEQWKVVLVVIASIGVVGALLYRTRGKYMPIIWIYLFKRRKGNEAFSKAYYILLKQLDRCKLHRKPGVTLRDHSKYVDQYFHTFGTMELLTAEYEKIIYRGNSDVISNEKWQTKWENLMRCTIHM
ncbi:MAG: transglutaminase [Bacillales bacterium]|nr:transglutaminase [Bacillales bacterium]